MVAAGAQSNHVIPLERQSTVPMSRQIYAGLRQAILNGTFRGGERLPSTRVMADQLSVSRTIVVIAYEQLLAEGFVSGRTGSGTFVSDQLTHNRVSDLRKPASLRLSRFGRYAQQASERITPPRSADRRLRYDFAYGRSNSDLFPFEAWRRLLIGRLRRAPIREFDYGTTAGSAALRQAIADHLRRTRGLACDSSEVVIVNGSQQALDIAARALLDVGDHVVLENPHYQGAREIFRAAGAKIVPVRVDAEGIVVSALPARAQMAFITPSHQFPTGAVLPLARRFTLLAWARRVNAVIVEDDYDGEFRYEGQAVEPLQALDRDARVIYVGTFSRTVFPSLRLGYLIAPKSLVPTIVATKWLCDRHTATLEQETMAEFIQSGVYERHLRRSRKILAERKKELLRSVGANLNEVEITGGQAGTHIVLWPVAHVDEREVIAEAAARDVGIYGISQYFIGRPFRPGFLLGYSRLTSREIHEGIRRLGQIACFRKSR
jgi:GntR family transcriptional regulator/MocR family aminotransferase